jgi:hypothetical protein
MLNTTYTYRGNMTILYSSSGIINYSTRHYLLVILKLGEVGIELPNASFKGPHGDMYRWLLRRQGRQINSRHSTGTSVTEIAWNVESRVNEGGGGGGTHPRAGTKITARMSSLLSPSANSAISFAACACIVHSNKGKEGKATLLIKR